MTAVLIVALPKDQPPLVWWSSRDYVIGASGRFDDPEPIGFEEAFRRYAERHDEAYWFESRNAAQAWAETYTGPGWLEVRAMIACAEDAAPSDTAVAG